MEISGQTEQEEQAVCLACKAVIEDLKQACEVREWSENISGGRLIGYLHSTYACVGAYLRSQA